MKQSRLMSFVEAIANVVVGYGIAVVTQLIVFPWFGLPARAFALRRLFEAIRVGESSRSRQ